MVTVFYEHCWIALRVWSSLSTSFLGGDEPPTESVDISVKYNMRKSLDLDQKGCYLNAGNKDCLQECGFNATAKTIFIIHGWTVS